MRLASLLIAALLSTPAIAQADVIDGWPTADICRAGVQAYFFLSEPPLHRGYNGFHQIQSAIGNAYKCQIAANNMIRLIWTSADSASMRSESTRYSIDGGMLTVTSDISEQVFARDGAGYVALVAREPDKGPKPNTDAEAISAADCLALRKYSVNSAETIFLFSKASSDLAGLLLQQALDALLSDGNTSENLKKVTALLSEASGHVDYRAAREAVDVLNRVCPP